MPKGKRVRSLPLWDQAARTFDALSRRGYLTDRDHLVFVGAAGGRLDYRTVKNEFYATLARAGFAHLRTGPEPFTYHDLRHSFGTLAVQVYPVTDVQVYMGHEKIETTMRGCGGEGLRVHRGADGERVPAVSEPPRSDPTERNSEQPIAA